MPAPSDAAGYAEQTVRPQRAPGIRVYPLGDDALVYLPATGAAFSLNRSARAILELCDGQSTVAEIGHELREAIGCPTEGMARDVGQGVAELRQAGLVSYG
jgi:PqqD family protein of HPr-rel-A system